MLCNGLFFVRFGIFVADLIKGILDQWVMEICFSEFFALLFSMLTNVQYVYAPAPRDVVAWLSSDASRYLEGIFIVAIRGTEILYR